MTKKLTILIIIISAIVLVFSGCVKKPLVNQNTNQNANQNINQNVSTNQNVNQNTNTNQNQNINVNSITPQEKTIKEATLSEPDENGWRTHINPLAGFMFKFQDPGKKIQFRGGDRDRSVFNQDDGSREGIYLYISRYNYDFNSYIPDKPTSFRELIEKYIWRDVDSALRLISLENVTYPNIEEGYIAVIEYNFGYIGHAILIQDPKKSNEYIRINNMKAELYNQILPTFKFLP